jgi:hypothetical protein
LVSRVNTNYHHIPMWLWNIYFMKWINKINELMMRHIHRLYFYFGTNTFDCIPSNKNKA